jgi:hypothetical protein
MPAVKKHLNNSLFSILFLIGVFDVGAQVKSNHFIYSIDLLMPMPVQDSCSLSKLPVSPLSQQFEAQNLPIFCKFEHLLGKNANYNIKMRLGDVQYVDQLEGKGISHYPK